MRRVTEGRIRFPPEKAGSDVLGGMAEFETVGVAAAEDLVFRAGDFTEEESAAGDLEDSVSAIEAELSERILLAAKGPPTSSRLVSFTCASPP
jgi:hypothetical protein